MCVITRESGTSELIMDTDTLLFIALNIQQRVSDQLNLKCYVSHFLILHLVFQ